MLKQKTQKAERPRSKHSAYHFEGKADGTHIQ